jgi:hypothetical protein
MAAYIKRFREAPPLPREARTGWQPGQDAGQQQQQQQQEHPGAAGGGMLAGTGGAGSSAMHGEAAAVGVSGVNPPDSYPGSAGAPGGAAAAAGGGWQPWQQQQVQGAAGGMYGMQQGAAAMPAAAGATGGAAIGYPVTPWQQQQQQWSGQQVPPGPSPYNLPPQQQQYGYPHDHMSVGVQANLPPGSFRTSSAAPTAGHAAAAATSTAAAAAAATAAAEVLAGLPAGSLPSLQQQQDLTQALLDRCRRLLDEASASAAALPPAVSGAGALTGGGLTGGVTASPGGRAYQPYRADTAAAAAVKSPWRDAAAAAAAAAAGSSPLGQPFASQDAAALGVSSSRARSGLAAAHAALTHTHLMLARSPAAAKALFSSNDPAAAAAAVAAAAAGGGQGVAGGVRGLASSQVLFGPGVPLVVPPRHSRVGMDSSWRLKLVSWGNQGLQIWLVGGNVCEVQLLRCLPAPVPLPTPMTSYSHPLILPNHSANCWRSVSARWPAWPALLHITVYPCSNTPAPCIKRS